MDLYKILEVPKNASVRDIKTSYRKLAKVYHPDRPEGDEEKFKQLSQAYEILSDNEKREIYDKFGMEGLKGNVRKNPFDVFQNFFGDGFFGVNIFDGDIFGRMRHQHNHQKKRKTNKEILLEVSLEQLYNGLTRDIKVTVDRTCQTCDGTGSRNKQVTSCNKCKGRGVCVQIRQIAPGMIQQSQAKCSECNGSGKLVGNPCSTCKGTTVKSQQIEITVTIPPGTMEGEQIKYPNMGDDKCGCIRGDIVLIIKEVNNSIFIRNGDDLVLHKEITLVEALCGLTMMIKHLDGRVLMIDYDEGKTIKDQSVKVVYGEGMPKKKTDRKGNLLIEFTVKLPEKLHDQQKIHLMKVFNYKKQSIDGNILRAKGIQKVNLKDAH